MDFHTQKNFRRIVYQHYAQNARSLPWRLTHDPYKILVSEIMLQQTQVPRVVEKYPLFIKRFPTIEILARAHLRSVIRAWQGLGYNRRALLLHRLAREVVRACAGRIPRNPEDLEKLPGIGEATAASICAFAFNSPVVFIETNIRSVFIHHFFKDRTNVNDQELLPYVEETLDRKNPWRWYSALMDYGVYLKSIVSNPSRRSRHYVKQSPFEGSRRQIRGMIMAMLAKRRYLVVGALPALVRAPAPRAYSVMEALCREGLIKRSGQMLTI
ncbi:MAG: A/G-specific adenine glycosylase [Candidatus Omnitrophota bacterium]